MTLAIKGSPSIIEIMYYIRLWSNCEDVGLISWRSWFNSTSENFTTIPLAGKKVTPPEVIAKNSYKLSRKFSRVQFKPVFNCVSTVWHQHSFKANTELEEEEEEEKEDKFFWFLTNLKPSYSLFVTIWFNVNVALEEGEAEENRFSSKTLNPILFLFSPH